MAANKKVIGEVNEAQIGIWKNQHGEVYEFRVDTEDSTHVCYMKEPPIDKIGAITSKMKTDEVEAAIMLVKMCFVGGDESFKSRIKLISGIGSKMSALIKSSAATVKKL